MRADTLRRHLQPRGIGVIVVVRITRRREHERGPAFGHAHAGSGWGDLQDKVRRHLLRSCSQHLPEKDVDLDEVLASAELAPIRDELEPVCRELAEVRKTKGGKKTYHLMIGCYFRDLALVWRSLRRVCASGAKVCFVVGDSAPYGVSVPVIPCLAALAEAAGFASHRFERTRDRNVKWKNRKHRVPLQEGRLWIKG